ncbi:MAG: hypothetical protein ACREBU_02130 [Nitrososphaera sp.]
MSERVVSIKGKIVSKDLGSPKALALMGSNIEEMQMGSIIGEVTKTVKRARPDGDEFVGFGGQFKATPLDKDRDIIISDTLFLPPGVFGILEASLIAAGDNPHVLFAFEVSVVRQNNPQGYSWKFTPKLHTSSSFDPFAEIEKMISVAAISAGSGSSPPPAGGGLPPSAGGELPLSGGKAGGAPRSGKPAA